MKNNLFSAIVIFVILFSACDSNKKLDQDTMVDLYVNVVIAEEAYPNNLDSLIAKRDSVFRKFGVTEEEYKNTLESYKEDKEYWDEFFPKALAIIDSLKKSVANRP